jgi:hypothetical protein
MHPTVQTPLILWGALLLSTFVYAGIGIAIGPQAAAPFDMTLGYVLTTASLVVAAVSAVLPPRLLGAAIGAMGAEASTDRETLLPKLRRRAMVSRILAWALSEAVALFGFVILVLGGPPFLAAPSFVLAWGLFVARFPSDGPLLRTFERVHERHVI